jgi:hypothetical protein
MDHDEEDELAIVDHEPNGTLFKTIRSLDNGAAPGPSGWTGHMLKCIAHDPECLQLLSTLVADIQNGNIPSEAKPYILASTLISIPKPDANIRPIACGEIIYRVTASRAVKLLSK